MNSESNQATTAAVRPDVNPDRAAALLANIQRTVGTPAPTAAAEKPAPDAPQKGAEKPAKTPKPTKPAARRESAQPREPAAADSAGGEEVSMKISLSPGKGQRVVYVRVDKTLADRLQLIAFQNKIAGTGGPTTVNEIGIEALTDWLDRHARAAA